MGEGQPEAEGFLGAAFCLAGWFEVRGLPELALYSPTHAAAWRQL